MSGSGSGCVAVAGVAVDAEFYGLSNEPRMGGIGQVLTEVWQWQWLGGSGWVAVTVTVALAVAGVAVAVAGVAVDAEFCGLSNEPNLS
jgi:hypothetical protein